MRWIARIKTTYCDSNGGAPISGNPFLPLNTKSTRKALGASEWRVMSRKGLKSTDRRIGTALGRMNITWGRYNDGERPCLTSVTQFSMTHIAEARVAKMNYETNTKAAGTDFKMERGPQSRVANVVQCSCPRGGAWVNSEQRAQMGGDGGIDSEKHIWGIRRMRRPDHCNFGICVADQLEPHVQLLEVRLLIIERKK